MSLQILIGILGRYQCGSSHKGPEGNGNPKKKRFALPLGLMWRCQLRISIIVVCTENPKMEGYYRLCSEAKRSQAEETPCSPWPSGPACSPPSSCSPYPSGAPFKPPAPAPWSRCSPRPRPAIRCGSEAEQLLVHAAQSLEQLGGFERGRCVRWHITHHSLTRRANCSEETVLIRVHSPTFKNWRKSTIILAEFYSDPCSKCYSHKETLLCSQIKVKVMTNKCIK